MILSLNIFSMTVHECQNLNQSVLDSKQTATIINRNENTQTSLANINASLNQALDELNKKYQASAQIANSGSILVAILTIGFIGLIIINDLVRALAFFVDSSWVRSMLNYLEVREMHPNEIESRWKKPNDLNDVEVNCVSQASTTSLVPASSKVTPIRHIAEHDPQIRVHRSFKPIGISLKKTPASKKTLMAPVDV